jgi:hypothetical protein
MCGVEQTKHAEMIETYMCNNYRGEYVLGVLFMCTMVATSVILRRKECTIHWGGHCVHTSQHVFTIKQNAMKLQSLFNTKKDLLKPLLLLVFCTLVHSVKRDLLYI